MCLKKVLADKAFCSEEIRNFEACIPDKSNAVVIHDFDEDLYKTLDISQLVMTNCLFAF